VVHDSIRSHVRRYFTARPRLCAEKWNAESGFGMPFLHDSIGFSFGTVLLPFICRHDTDGRYISDFSPLLSYPRSKPWRHVANLVFLGAVEWTELNGFYMSLVYETVVRYDPLDDVWNQLPTPLCSTGQEFGLAASESKLFLVGDKNVPQNLIVSYLDIQSEKWELVNSTLKKKSMFGASLFNGHIYAVGGYTHCIRWRYFSGGMVASRQQNTYSVGKRLLVSTMQGVHSKFSGLRIV